MNPKIDNIEKKNNVMQFTLSGVNVSLANALRRTILSDIETVVFKTSPYEENKAIIISNTSRLNNEVIKQRLSCIPIHIEDLETPFQNLIMEINEVNDTDSIMYVTTEHFKIKDKTTQKYLSEQDTRSIFPPNPDTNYYIDFVRLRPKISDELPGEKLHMSCEFTLGTCKEDGMFNVVSTCAYGFTQDVVLIQSELEKKLQTWRDAGMKKEEIEFEKKNWMLLDAMRLTLKNSFEFIIETVGVFSCKQLMIQACDVLIKRLYELNDIIESNTLSIEPAQNTMANCYDITLENEDYTIGKIIEYMLHALFYETGEENKRLRKEKKGLYKNKQVQEKITAYNANPKNTKKLLSPESPDMPPPLLKRSELPISLTTSSPEKEEEEKESGSTDDMYLTYCGFKKFHPHDSHSIIRVASKNPSSPHIISLNLQICISESIKVYTTIKEVFLKLRE
jgi:DNA-directed RNA polymerase alpha subunit